VRFAVIGDFGLAGEGEAAVAEMVKSWQPDLIITTGDNNYPYGEPDTIDENIGQYYHEFIAPYMGEYGPGADTNRFFPTLGNHDLLYQDGQPYFDYFSLPGNERYYDFTWGPVHFFALNSNSTEVDGFRPDSIQALWLRDRLAASSLPWKVVYMHHAPYSSGTQESVTWMRWPFEEWGASAVLAGHDHTYQRMHIGNIPYIVNGLGGGAIYALEEEIEGTQFRYNGGHGAMLAEADETSLTFRFFTREREELDAITLTK
jgi:hypothetical protein